MAKYRVHIYREMRLVFEGIEAETPQAAAQIAADKHFDECDDWSDCEGTTLAALVDEEGQDDGIVIDFEDGRMLRAAPHLLGACIARHMDSAHHALSRALEDPDGGNDEVRDAAIDLCDALTIHCEQRRAAIAEATGGAS